MPLSGERHGQQLITNGSFHASKGKRVVSTGQSSAMRSQSSDKLRLVLSTSTSIRLGSQTATSLAVGVGSVQPAKTGTRALGRRSVCVPPLPPIRLCFLATSCALWSLFRVRSCCIVHTTSCQIDQTIALCLFISKLVGEAGREECTMLLGQSRRVEMGIKG